MIFICYDIIKHFLHFFNKNYKIIWNIKVFFLQKFDFNAEKSKKYKNIQKNFVFLTLRQKNKKFIKMQVAMKGNGMLL